LGRRTKIFDLPITSLKSNIREGHHRRVTPSTAHLSVLLKRMGLLRPNWSRLAMTGIGRFSNEMLKKTGFKGSRGQKRIYEL
jgi:hypothetical protein